MKLSRNEILAGIKDTKEALMYIDVRMDEMRLAEVNPWDPDLLHLCTLYLQMDEYLSELYEKLYSL